MNLKEAIKESKRGLRYLEQLDDRDYDIEEALKLLIETCENQEVPSAQSKDTSESFMLKQTPRGLSAEEIEKIINSFLRPDHPRLSNKYIQSLEFGEIAQAIADAQKGKAR